VRKIIDGVRVHLLDWCQFALVAVKRPHISRLTLAAWETLLLAHAHFPSDTEQVVIFCKNIITQKIQKALSN